MPRRAFRCVVNLTLNEVTAPGVWLPSREDVYLGVSLFGQYKTTRLLLPVFPLPVYEKLRFEKTYYSALDLAEVADYLSDEVVIFELVQLSDYTDATVRLASFASSAGDFLHPVSSDETCCLSTDHEILLSRTIAFSGMSPRFSFSTRTLIKESLSPELDALEDALEEEKGRRLFKKTHRVPTRKSRSAKSMSSSRHNISLLGCYPNEDDPPPRYLQHTKSSLSRCRSLSQLRNVADIDLSDSTDSRPAFVVRRLEEDLTKRVPGGAHYNHNTNASKKDKQKKEASKSKSETKSKKEKKERKESSQSSDNLDLDYTSPKHHSQVDELLHGSLNRQPLHLHLSDDEDDAVYIARRRPHSASASMRYRPRFGYYLPPAQETPLFCPPECFRLVPCYEPSIYDLNY